MAATLDTVLDEIRGIKADARQNGSTTTAWPMIVLRSPKGWTCPKEIDGKRTEDYWRCHQVPMGEMHESRVTSVSGKVDEELQAGGTLRRPRQAHTRAGRTSHREAPAG